MKRLTKSAALLAVCFICLLSFGCKEDRDNISGSIDAGTVVTADVIPTSFNESIKTTIKTTKGVFTITGTPFVMVGNKATIDNYQSGRSYLCVEEWPDCKRIFR